MKRWTIFTVIVIFVAILAACGGQGPAGPTPTPPTAATATPTVQATAELAVAETATALAPSPTSPAGAVPTETPASTPLPPTPTLRLTPSPAPTPVATPTAAPAATPTTAPAPTLTSASTPTPVPVLGPTATPQATPTPAPTVTPTSEPAATPVAVPDPLEWPVDVGTSHFGQLGDSASGFAGAWIRPHAGSFIWGLVQERGGQYDWGATDKGVRGWQRDRLAVLVTIWPFASWDQDSCHADQPKAQGTFPGMGERLYSPCDPQAYAAWLGTAVERYDGDGVDDMPGLEYPVRHWEILNEPEMQGPELTFFQEDSAAYLELLKLSYTTIKAADPNAVILTGGQAGMQAEFVDYWQPVLKGGGSHFDVGNVHSIGSDEEFFAPDYRAFLDSLGYDAKPFWVTEALVGSPPGGLLLSEDGLARITLTGYASALAAGAQVILNVGAHDPTGGPGQASEEIFQLMARTVGDFTSVTKLTDNAIRFDMPDGRTVFALWDGASLPQDVTGEVNVITCLGDESTSDAGAVTSTVPVLVVIE